MNFILDWISCTLVIRDFTTNLDKYIGRVSTRALKTEAGGM